ncbi:MAG: TonB-dependent receptor [Woeseiaceae bacterium]|nr:TonB-dependent receptor [Woeseiaceae bacterium]
MKNTLYLAFRARRLMAATAIVSVFGLLASIQTGFAQETTSSVRGTVTTPSGAPAANVTVAVTDTRTGSTRTVTTNSQGGFQVRGLVVGGPYEIRVTSNQYKAALITDVYTNLSAAATFNIPLEEGEIEEIIVTASRDVAVADLAIGPGSAFSLEDIEAMPSIARQIRDVIRIDPRVSIARQDNGAGSGINCLGGSSRSNAITIDGAVANDGFGLNEGTGTSARFAFPIPYDTVQSASVEFAPLDVQYSQFTGCAINIVTKPGSNEFHGSAFYLYNDDSLTGDKINGVTVISDPFEDKNYGFDLSGPIIRDHLFFTIAYEETDEGGVQNTGPSGGGFANELSFITVAEAEAIKTVLQNQYGRDPGPIVRTLPQTSERWFARLDWNINDQHRAELTYTQLEELNLDPDDMPFDGFTFQDNFENEGIDQDTISLRVFSNWTDNFSTEFRYSTFDVVDIQGPVGGGEEQDPNPITRIQVLDAPGGDPIFTSGPGEFRSANDLQYTIDQIKLAADWVVGDHTLTFGVEQETRDVFNLFIPLATGTLQFDDINALMAGTASSIFMLGSFTQVAADAAANFERDINSYYVQDEWQVNDSVTVVAGLRFDEYSSSDIPIANPVFQQRYGISNTQTFDGLDLLQPRIGLTWDLPEWSAGATQLRAGFGIFGGGDPTVHFANAYQNFGGAIGFGASFLPPCTAADLQVINGGQFTGLPDCVRVSAANAANANTGAVAAVDPNFDLPSNHRWNIGLNHVTTSDYSFFDNWEIQFDYIYTDHKDAVDWVDLRLTPNGVTMPDGRPQFFEVDPLLPGCMATFNGIRQGFSNAGTNGGPCDDTDNSNQDILMTNGVEGETSSISIQFAKEFYFSDRTSLNLGLGYAYLDSKTGNPVNSSTAGSSYEEVAVAVLNNVRKGPNLWSNKHNIVLRANFRHEWADGYPFSVGVFFQRRSGRPFSYAYEDDTGELYFGDSDDESRILIHVPTGPNDPLYDFSGLSASDVTALFEFLDRSGLSAYAGGIAPKNGFYGPWYTDMDIRIQQDFALPWGWGDRDHVASVFFDIENALNLILGDDDNIRSFPDVDDVQEAARVLEVLGDISNTNQFVVNDWYDEGIDQDVDDSVWRLQLGFRYRF